MSDDSELDKSYNLGISVGLRRAYKFVMDAAASRWANYDDHADTLRCIATSLRVMAEKSEKKT